MMKLEAIALAKLTALNGSYYNEIYSYPKVFQTVKLAGVKKQISLLRNLHQFKVVFGLNLCPINGNYYGKSLANRRLVPSSLQL